MLIAVASVSLGLTGTRTAPSGTGSHILVYRNSTSGAGVNARETVLTPNTVNVTLFGKRFSTTVDGQIYAQPLYVSGLQVAAGSRHEVHDVVFVVTQHNSLYAIDADDGEVLWHRSFIDTDRGITTVPAADTGAKDIAPEIGITATPVIDLATRTIFVQAKTKEVRAGEPDPHYVQHLIGVNISTGEVLRRVVIADTTHAGGSQYTYNSGPYVVGRGLGHIVVDGQPRVYLNALRQLFRPALLLHEGNIYAATASHGDIDPYHGWVLSYDAATLALNAVFNTTPNGEMGGIWQSGANLTIDSRGFLYFETGNGSFEPVFDAAGFPVDGNYGNSFVKVVRDPASTIEMPNINGWGVKVADYFTPFNEDELDLGDSDLGSGAPLILPDSAGSAEHPRLLVGGSKEGRIYLIDRDNMGKHDRTTDRVVQQQPSAVGSVFGSPAFFEGHLYFTGVYDGPIRKYSIASGQLSPKSVGETPDDFGPLDGSPIISADGSANGILWNLHRRGAELRAYDATDLSRRLYSSNQPPGDRDRLQTVQKFSVPIVADGRVFVATVDALVAYGPRQLPSSPAAK